jgi:iron complex outermembrane receptor protein
MHDPLRPFAVYRRLLPILALAAAAQLPPFVAPSARAQEPAAQAPGPQEPAASPQSPTPPSISEKIEVTATRVPEDVEPVPSSITVVSGEEIQARGATDLAGALATVAGVAIAPGGDGGPASAIPELWGLREFDAFLLVVDGVPWGGAFNPALSALDLTDVERIEVLRGSAPVMYGATSFVGVIHVIHRQPGAAGGTVHGAIGSYGTGDLSASAPLPQVGEYRQSLSVHGERQGFRDDRADFGRGNLLYRGALTTTAGTFRVDFNTAIVRQSPASPIPRDGTRLTPLVPLDSNQNPRGARIDDDRFHLTTGWDAKLGSGAWSTTLAVTHLTRRVGRGFLENFVGTDPDDHGIRQHLTTTDLYFDSHVAFDLARDVRLIAGIDHLFGKAHNASEDWDYFQNVNGTNPPSIDQFRPFGATDLHDTRNFSGLYAQVEWTPQPRLRIQAGGRLNHTHESLDTTAVSFPMAPVAAIAAIAAVPAAAAAAGPDTGPAPPPVAKDVSVGPGSDRRTVTRGSGAVGASYLVWQQAGAEGIWLYADYRNSFKPAALDFGPDVNGVVLAPETAQAYEVGLKGRQRGGFDWELSVFQMNFTNLVVGRLNAEGLPELVSAGKERFKGAELEIEYRLARDLSVQAVYSYHDARFRDFIDVSASGDNVQVGGNRLPLSAHHLGGAGLLYRPPTGLTAWATLSYVGNRFLDRENVALVPSYTTWAGGVGYRFARWELRLDGWNLNNTRPPVAASEFGPNQYYVLPARSFRLAGDFRF